MKNRFSLIFLALLVFSVVGYELRADSTDNNFVRQNHPDISTSGAVGDYAFIRADLDGTGIDEYLIAAYSNTVADTDSLPGVFLFGNLVVWKGLNTPFTEIKRALHHNLWVSCGSGRLPS